ncbi:hypothetical protein [Streptosporangium album]
MKRLDEHRRSQGITLVVVAGQLGTYKSTLSKWSSGSDSPLFHRAVAYASAVNARIVLPHQGRVLAEGLDIVDALPDLRRFVGAPYRRMAARVGLHYKTLETFEARTGPRYLSTVEMYAAGLGLSLGMLPAVELAVAP